MFSYPSEGVLTRRALHDHPLISGQIAIKGSNYSNEWLKKEIHFVQRSFFDSDAWSWASEIRTQYLLILWFCGPHLIKLLFHTTDMPYHTAMVTGLFTCKQFIPILKLNFNFIKKHHEVMHERMAHHKGPIEKTKALMHGTSVECLHIHKEYM